MLNKIIRIKLNNYKKLYKNKLHNKNLRKNRKDRNKYN